MSPPFPPKPKLNLFILPGALYTRRVLIYLFEKGLITSNSTPAPTPFPKGREVESKYMNMKITKVKSTLSGKMIAEGKPEGSVPLLVVNYDAKEGGEGGGEGERGGEEVKGRGEDKVVIGSLEIISYFEALSSSPPPTPTSIPKGSMSGHTPEEITQIKERNVSIEEATTYFEEAARKGSAMFAFLERRDREASRAALERCRVILSSINEYYVNNPHFTFTSSTPRREVNISDILLFTLLQFAYVMYNIQLWDGLPGLEAFYRWFEKRESVFVEGTEEEVWDGNLRIVASCWVGDGGTVWEWGRVAGLLFRAVGGVIWGLVGKGG